MLICVDVVVVAHGNAYLNVMQLVLTNDLKLTRFYEIRIT